MDHLQRKLNLNYFIIAILVFSIFSTSVNLVLAAPVASSPTCEIKADVLSVEKTKTVTPPINAPSQEIEYYSVNLKILKVSTLQDEGRKTCDDLYPVNSEKETIIFPDDYGQTFFTSGQRIRGQVHFSGDERFHGTFLSNVSVISQQISILEPSEVSEEMVRQNYVNNIDSVLLQPDQQTYSVRGTRKGRLLSFIPVTLNIQLEVNPITGAVKSVKKPWWSFLVR